MPAVQRWLSLALLVFCLLKLILMGLSAIGAQFVMDEYVPLGYYGELIGSFYLEVDPIKTVLYVYLYQAATWFADDAVSQMLAARLETYLVVIVGLVFLYATNRNLGRSRQEALFSLAVLLSFSTYLERSFRLRSDSFASVFAVLALWAIARREPGRGWSAAGGILAGLAFLCTQKSIYFLIALVVGYALAWASSPTRRLLSTAGWMIAGWTFTLLVYAVVFGGFQWPRVLVAVFTSPMEVAFQADDYYVNLRRYVSQTLTRNVFAYGLCFAGLILQLVRLRRAPSEARTAVGFTLALTVLVFSHNQPWPYVFVLVLPFLALSSVEVVRSVAPDQGRRSVVMLIVVVLLMYSFKRNLDYLGATNQLQNRVVAQAEALLAPTDTYCDGIRMVVTRVSACREWWDAMTVEKIREQLRRNDFSNMDALFERPPKLWIYNYRVRALWPTLEGYIAPSYVPVTPHILLSGVLLQGVEAATFVNRWPGSYELYDLDGRPVKLDYELDGRPLHGPVHLDAESYRVRLAVAGLAYLLPSGSELFEGMPRDSPIEPLFPNVYER
ncbi:MAG: hypothetical protein OEM62_04165 [Acidobacteriota bacterium]|nr:hypothetical protein [Acidobacteriota bacterium]